VKLRELFEVKAGNIGKRYQQATRGLNTFGDGERSSGDYTQYYLQEMSIFSPHAHQTIKS
jgi:hypothetical protein